MAEKDKNNKEIEKTGIIEEDIIKEMQTAYLDYAMSVITSRALPDVRDGLKPVHRRVLYAMRGLHLNASSKTRKSAAVVGEVMGKYHPHGNIAIYDAVAKLVQDFSTRYPLIIGQGNFGSIDGDSPAADRYTEVKLSALAEQLLADIEKETVLFRPNYENTLTEPVVLPSLAPNLLLNGTLGIAVGMATNMPPHNVNEVCDAVVHLLDTPDATNKDLLAHIKGPDFPLGGIVYDKKAIESAYSTGRGGVVVQGDTEVVEDAKGHTSIVISSIPYRVNRADLLIKIASLVQEKKIEGIKNLRDESAGDTRIVVELKSSAHPSRILSLLYKHTQLQTVYHYNMVALVDGSPQTLSLRAVVQYHIDHRREVIKKRTEYLLKKAQAREHILEGLTKALVDIDAVVNTIRKSKDGVHAHSELQKTFSFSPLQATAILEMRLQKLAGLERLEVENELKDIQKKIKELKALLKSKEKVSAVIREEMVSLKKAFGDDRRTSINPAPVGEMSDQEMIPDEKTVIVITENGYIKRTPIDEYRAQKRGGSGSKDLNTKEEDAIRILLNVSLKENIFFFTNYGNVYTLCAYDIAEGKRSTKGKSVANFLSLAQDEKVTSVVPVKDSTYLLFATKKGVIKKTESKNFAKVRKTGVKAIGLSENDSVVSVIGVSDENVMLATYKGKAIHFETKKLRSIGRTGRGVKGITLDSGDTVVSAVRTTKGYLLLATTENGYGKMTAVSEYKTQTRGGKGIRVMSVTEKTGSVASILALKSKEDDLLAMSKKGQAIRFNLSEVPKQGRTTQGVRIMNLHKDDSLSTIVHIH